MSQPIWYTISKQWFRLCTDDGYIADVEKREGGWQANVRHPSETFAVYSMNMGTYHRNRKIAQDTAERAINTHRGTNRD